MKFLLAENLSYRHAARLRADGHDAVAAVESSLGGASDADIIRYLPKGTPGIIWMRLHPPSEAKIEQAIDRCLDKLNEKDLAGKLAVVDEDKIRVRG